MKKNFGYPFTLIFLTLSANLKVKGVKIEFFTQCMTFRKVTFFIYEKNYLSDRVPLSVLLIEYRTVK